MKALVFGGTGPTGPYVIDGLLKRGYQVTIFHRGTHEIDLPQEVEHIHGDPHFVETLEEALGGGTYDLTVAMYGRLRFTAQVMQKRTPRFIAVGGVGVYRGWINLATDEPCLIPIPEDAPMQDQPEVDKFSYRMVEAEWAVMEAHNAGHYNATHFRYPMIYGPRQLAPREWSIVRRILDGRQRLILADGGLTIESRGYAENMAHALMLAVDKPEACAGQIYNVRDDGLLTTKDWVNVIANMMGHRFEFVEMPYALARPARIYTGRSQHRVLDISKVKAELGYQDVVPIEKAVELSARFYLENRPAPGGETEQQLRDPFDYDAEDRIIDKYFELAQQVREVAPAALGFRHPYSHPKKPGEQPTAAPGT